MTFAPKGECLGEVCPKFADLLTTEINEMGVAGAEANARRTADVCAEVGGCALEMIHNNIPAYETDLLLFGDKKESE